MNTRTVSKLYIVLEDVKIPVLPSQPGPASRSSQVAGRRNTGSESLWFMLDALHVLVRIMSALDMMLTKS